MPAFESWVIIFNVKMSTSANHIGVEPSRCKSKFLVYERSYSLTRKTAQKYVFIAALQYCSTHACQPASCCEGRQPFPEHCRLVVLFDAPVQVCRMLLYCLAVKSCQSVTAYLPRDHVDQLVYCGVTPQLTAKHAQRIKRPTPLKKNNLLTLSSKKRSLPAPQSACSSSLSVCCPPTSSRIWQDFA